MSAPRWLRIRSRTARSRSQRFCSAWTLALRLEISSVMVAAERVSCGPWSLEQTTAFNERHESDHVPPATSPYAVRTKPLAHRYLVCGPLKASWEMEADGQWEVLGAVS